MDVQFGRQNVNRFRQYLLLLTFCVLGSLDFDARADEETQISSASPAEFLLYQYPGAYLVVKTDARETEFESRIFDPEGTLLKHAAVPARRVGPVYQLIDATDKPRQLRVEVRPSRPIDRSEISMELLRFTIADPNNGPLVQAYGLLSSGTEAVYSRDTTTWATKIYTLKNAARAFGGLGMEEMRLWSEYYAAHLVLHGLRDELTAMERAAAIRAAARTAGLEIVRLAAMLLEGEAVFRLNRDASDPAAAKWLDRAHEVFAGASVLAAELAYPSEQARALYSDALTYDLQGKRGKALELYGLAIDVALAADDNELANEVRAQAAVAFEAEGQTSSAIDVLEDISSDLEQRDSTLELARTLSEQGRLLNAEFRYPEAAAELNRALQLLQSARAGYQWGPTGLALAHAYFGMGQMERAAALILESEVRTPLPQYASLLADAYGTIANIHRYQGRFETMQSYREKQLALESGDAPVAAALLEQAVDVTRSTAPGASQALRLLQQSRDLAWKSGARYTAYRATMRLCLAGLERNDRHDRNGAELESARAGLRASAIPRLMLEADQLSAKIYLRRGDYGAALSGFEQLVDELGLFRTRVPGVLGGWYWENREEVFNEYLSLVMTARPGEIADGARALLALERVRAVERLSRPVSGQGESAGSEALRAGLARLDAFGQGRAGEIAIAESVLDQIGQQRRLYRDSRESPDAKALKRLTDDLANDESLLTYHFSEQRIHALVATRKGVHLLGLERPQQLHSLLQALPFSLSSKDSGRLEALGDAMLKPLARLLTRRIYFLPAGPLIGFPLDLMRLRGDALVEQHQVVNLSSLAALKRRKPEFAPADGRQVFVAGNPQPRQDLFSYDYVVPAEIRLITDRFVGPGLHVVQGAALRRDEFDDDRVFKSDLLHLAVPAVADLTLPDRSMLLLSGVPDGPPDELLVAPQIREYRFEARLAVLGGLSVEGQSPSSFSNVLGLVSDFHSAGVPAVIATLWRVDPLDAAEFTRDFYDRLEKEPELGAALWDIRRSRMRGAERAGSESWAAFQLFIR